jgi:hypothetical protein
MVWWGQGWSSGLGLEPEMHMAELVMLNSGTSSGEHLVARQIVDQHAPDARLHQPLPSDVPPEADWESERAGGSCVRMRIVGRRSLDI